MKLNDDLEHVRVGEEDQVPIEEYRNLWFLWIYENGDWDAERITREGNILREIKKNEVNLIFCSWHGRHKTDLFLMDKNKLINRLEKLK